MSRRFWLIVAAAVLASCGSSPLPGLSGVDPGATPADIPGVAEDTATATDPGASDDDAEDARAGADPAGTPDTSGTPDVPADDARVEVVTDVADDTPLFHDTVADLPVAPDAPIGPDVPPPPACLETPSVCEDDDPCTGDWCDPAEGCVHVPLTGHACEDGSVCTVGDQCAADGRCVPGALLSCDDDDPCTDDVCDPASGCAPVYNQAPCDDGNGCTQDDVCVSGTCAGSPLAGGCQCQATADCAAFEDGNPCNGTLVCKDHLCVVNLATVVACDTSADTACRKTTCDPATGLCTQKALPVTTACDDQDACTTADHCAAGGVCVGGVTPTCDDGNPCTDDSCSPATGCVHANNSAPCAAARCDGLLAYPQATCAGGACPAQVAVSCDDKNACTTGEACANGACQPATGTLDCDDDNVCTNDSCAPKSGCLHAPNSLPCAQAKCEGLVHLGASTCSQGVCPAPVAVDCASGKPCMTDACDPSGVCSHMVVANACVVGGTCLAAGQASATDPCRICDPARDVFAWSVAADGWACGAGRACLAGVCTGPMITEFMSSNRDTIDDADGDSSDWIEVYNPTTASLSLEGWHLTDNPALPAKWTFPAVALLPGHYRVVFASGKNRADPSAELHTNFKLDGEGEYLALVTPDLAVVQAFDAVPPQATDVSYGVAVNIAKSPFVQAGSPIRYLVPSGANPPAAWTSAGFDDAAAGWIAGTVGIGFDSAPAPEKPPSSSGLGLPVADSLAEWSTAGTQGANGWYYGFWNRTADADGAYSADAFVPFPRDGLGYGAHDYWTGSGWDWYAGNPPWTYIGRETTHPNGTNSGPEHWAIRRWISDVSAPLYVEWRIARGNANGDGTTGYVFHQGVQADRFAIAGADTAGTTRTVVLANVKVGDAVDFAISPVGPGGQVQDWYDSTVLTGAAWQMPDLGRDVSTDVVSMAGKATTLYVRAPFVNDGATAFNRLWLRVKYDDGFAAWLQGQPIASANAPAVLSWDATATTDRSLQAATTFVTYDLRDRVGQLSAGANVLALQALNVSAQDTTLLLLPELEGRRVTYTTAKKRYYGVPTPGEDNDDGPGYAGPIVQHEPPTGAVSQGQAIDLSVDTFPTGQPVSSATLFYRVMFGPEVQVPMTDAGSGVYTASIPADAAAPGQMIRWYFVAKDAFGNKGRAPTFLDPLDSEEYYGTVVSDPSVVSNLPILHWFVQDLSAAGTRTGTRCAVFYDGEFYDNVRADLHGQSTAGFPKKSYDIDFNSDHRFRLSDAYRRMKDINLLTNYADKSKLRNTLAYETLRDTGSAYHLAFPMRVQRNGAFFAVTDFVEDGDDRWLERVGKDPEGALYKEYDGLYDPAKAEKKTRKDEDKADLTEFIAGLDLTDDALRNYLFDHVDVAAMANYYAGLTMTANMDCCHKNFYAYRDTNGSGEWSFLPWDVDLTFGRNWIKTLTYFDDTLHPQNGLFAGGGNKLTKALYAAIPEFRDMYLRRLRSLMDALLQPPGTPATDLRYERRIDELLAQIGADGATDHAAWPTWGQDQTMEVAAGLMETDFLAPRRVFLYETQGAAGGGPIPDAQVDPVVLFGAWDASPAKPDEAWLTVENPNDFAVDVSGWQITGDVAYTFRPGTVLPAEGTIYVAADSKAFRARAVAPTGGMGLFVQGSWQGALAQVESLVLVDADGVPARQQ